ncbi:MAG: RHS repeat-associated core domain-containing protein, partial [Verrucomicrobia bacterium]|nr:RHS repeat-associated core domain-containing protein [Verrucomicrobiota bacterium]
VRSYMWGKDLSGTLNGAGLPAASPACAGTADRDAAQAGGVGGLLGVDDADQGFHFVAYDGNGNVMALVDADDGTDSAEYEYGPFGELIRVTGPMSDNPIRFSTKYHDTETGLVYYGYRYYWPAIGRWLNRDPIGERGGMNLNCMLRNNSIGRIDRLGFLENNTPSGNLTIYYSAQPCGNAKALLNSTDAQVAKSISIKIIVAATGKGGKVRSGEIGPFPIGARWLPMAGNEAPNVACRMKYKCAIKCCCKFGSFNPKWSGNKEWVYGRIVSRMKINQRTGRQRKDMEGNWMWADSKCVIDNKQLTKAKKDCQNTSKGRCKIEIQLRSY